MAIKTILVHLGSAEANENRLKLALNLAKANDALLIGLFVKQYPVVPGFVASEIGPEVIESQRAVLRRRAEEVEKQFKTQTSDAGVKAEYRTEEGDPIELAVEQSRTADLVVVGQSTPEGEDDFNIPDHLALDSGHPVLVVPYAGDFASVGKRVMITWNGTREAARALSDAMPFLTDAEEVVVLAVNAPGESQISCKDVVAQLERKGIKAKAQHITASAGMSVADTILSALSDNSSDLLVMGAYGHSRMREMVLGGVTRSILGHMTVPVLLSH